MTLWPPNEKYKGLSIAYSMSKEAIGRILVFRFDREELSRAAGCESPSTSLV